MATTTTETTATTATISNQAALDQAMANVETQYLADTETANPETETPDAETANPETETPDAEQLPAIATLDLKQKNHYTRVLGYVDQFKYKIDSTTLDDCFILIIGTVVDCDTIDGRFFDEGSVLLSKGRDSIYKEVGDIKDGDFRCNPMYKTLLSAKVQKFCSTQIARLTRNRVKADESKIVNRIKRDGLLSELMAD